MHLETEAGDPNADRAQQQAKDGKALPGLGSKDPVGDFTRVQSRSHNVSSEQGIRNSAYHRFKQRSHSVS